MNILNILKNNVHRTIAQKASIVIALIVIPLMIGAGIFFSGKEASTGRIAYISTQTANLPKDSRVQIDVLQKKPPISSLLIGKYAAIVENRNGRYTVTTLKNMTDKIFVEKFFEFGKITEKVDGTKKKTGSTVIGYILMLLLMQGVTLITLYTDDRDKKTLRRVLVSPTSEKIYLLSQEIFTFLCILIPSYVTLVITKCVFRVDINFGYGKLFLLVAIISALSTSLALLAASALGSEYSLTATGIYVITSIISGCYISFSSGNRVIDVVCSLLPQKAFMTMVKGLETGKSLPVYRGQILYLLGWVLAAYIFGSIINNKKRESM